MLWHVTGAWVKSEFPPCRPSDTAWESYPGVVRPTCTVRPSPALCGCCAGRSVSFHDIVSPTLVPPPRRPPRKSVAAPLKEVRPPTLHPSGTMSRRKAGEAGLPSHLRPCAAIPATVPPSWALQHYPITVGTHVDGTSPRPPLCGLRSSVSRALESAYGRRPSKSSIATTLETAPGPAQDPPRRPPEARFARTTVNSTTLCAMPPHVALRPSRHDCKPPPLGL
jgi:hypothetical protein